MIVLIDFMDGEIGGVDGGFQVGLERRVDLAQLLPDHAAEEGVLLDFRGAVFAAGGAEAVVHVAEESVGC